MCCLQCELEKSKMADHNILCSIEYIRSKQSCPLHRIESQTDEPLQVLEELGYALVIPHVLKEDAYLNKELKDMMDVSLIREVGVDVPEDLPTQGPSQNKKPKKSRSSRASYGDDAISYVQLKRDAHLCTVKCKMCPEHKVHAKLYGCTLIIDEEDDVIVSVVCEDCVASRALIEKVKEETIEQSKSNLWFELRYGRITASKAYEVSRCKTADGTLVSLILGGKIPETKHMKRGRVLEDQVRRTVEDMLKKLPSAVLY
ncbi:hypothetical protein EVAR_13996_1 [Eumeta japonica]|uniref:Uncharacterized protein n=2 Tax=Eumeta variegata TaxID=151549 RepID=A0A4C1U8L3_EUMVA|nr:hypothetical protein EVAR_13996_1 [Eumeta japonica]